MHADMFFYESHTHPDMVSPCTIREKGIFMQQSNQLVRLMEIAIMTSLALVLDYLSGLF